MAQFFFSLTTVVVVLEPLGPDVVVEEPAEIRQRVVDRLTAAVAGLS